MKTVSILGCGWLGKPLAASLLKKGYVVKGSTTSEEKLEALREVGIIPFLIDISQESEIGEFLASEILIVAITSKDYESFNRLISQIRQSTIKQVIFISSTSVYENLNKVIKEEEATSNSPLIDIENLFRKESGFGATIIRFAGLLGGNRHPGNWFKGRKIGQPNGFVNMIHREDCIGVIQEIINQECWNETLNACSNHHPTRREFYTNAKLKLGLEVPEFIEEAILSYKIISSEKLQRKLNYVFQYDDLLAI
ncbi:Putative enzyme of sugar metabolism YeeZ precursor [Tenacibaculum maritimum]|uniref:SDR family oxidoreductase n=1 Tax=Tenacibaculum maritimum TaxID=107401 RepID=UPI0012E5D448|nr:SDR family oxidoreductase [Tenacibaculum maritimum]CAA0170950.1 Putative enzyme of sugar metabolism YeeZ precursor [Tenacibaculum maritimum]CAA0223380.1 Putative enzyme of sugar metabolism YeeZ precursor [Tenacibaculum maritimum]